MPNYNILISNAQSDNTITTLNLRGNNIGDQGAKDLAEGLKDTQVTTLNLRGNNIGSTEIIVENVLQENKKNAQKVVEGFKTLLEPMIPDKVPVQESVEQKSEDSMKVDIPSIVFKAFPLEVSFTKEETSAYINFVSIMQKMPCMLSHVINQPEIPYTKGQIIEFQSTILTQFSDLVLRYEWDAEEYLSILTQCDNLTLDKVVERLLLAREDYIDVSKDDKNEEKVTLKVSVSDNSLVDKDYDALVEKYNVLLTKHKMPLIGHQIQFSDIDEDNAYGSSHTEHNSQENDMIKALGEYIPLINEELQ